MGQIQLDHSDIHPNFSIPSNQYPTNQFTVRLSIKNVVMSDAGIYYCRANNSVGEDYQDFKVNVAAGRRRNPGMG